MSISRILLPACLILANLAFAQTRLVLPVGHTAEIKTAEFSPAGRWVVTGSADETAKVWDVITGALVFDLRGKAGSVVRAQFSNDEKKILTLHYSVLNHITIWDAQTGIPLYSIKDENKYEKTSFALFSPDNNEIIIARSGVNSIYRYRTSDGKLLSKWKAHEGSVFSAYFSPDEKELITWGTDSLQMTWSLATGQLVKQVKFNTAIDEWKFTTRRSPNGEYEARIRENDNMLLVWKRNSVKPVIDTSAAGDVLSFSYSNDSKRLVTVSFDRIVRIWELESGRLVSEMKGHTFPGADPKFSGDNNTFSMIAGDSTIKVWDLAYAKLLYTLRGHKNRINSIQFSPDRKHLVSGSSDNSVIYWDIADGRLLKRMQGHMNKIVSVAFSPDGNQVLSASSDHTAKIWDVATGRIKFDLIDHTGAVTAAGFSPDGKLIATSSEDRSAIIWDAATGKRVHTLNEHRSHINGLGFSPDGKTLATVSSDNTAMLWDINSGKRLAHLNSNPYVLYMRTAEFSPDGTQLLTNSLNGMDIWDVKSGTLLKSTGDDGNNGIFSKDGKRIITRLNNWATIWQADSIKPQIYLKGHNASVLAHNISPDGKHIVTLAADNSATLWNADSGKALCNFYAIDKDDYLFQTNEGFFLSSPGAARQIHYITKDLEVLSFEQLDLKFNRPDKVLEAIGNTDSAFIRSYRQAWEKRIKRLGIDTTAFREGFSIPYADFINRKEIPGEQNLDRLTLRVKASDSIFAIDRFNVWVNDVPLFGQNGIKTARNLGSLDTTFTIRLSNGNNRIETSIVNVNGIESYHVPLFVHYAPKKPQGESVYYVGIGIDRFRDEKYDLQFSTKDIRDLALQLKKRYGARLIIDTLFNENVTVEKIKSLKDRLKKTSVNDKVIISYSGHGLLNAEYDYFLSTFNINFEHPEQNGLPYDELENLLDGIPSRKKLLLIDACHSGEVDREDLVTLANAPDSLIKGLKPVAYKKTNGLGLKNSFELMQSLFVNVGKSTGATVISAAAGTQFALERNDLKNGVFTFSLLELLRKEPSVKISELKKRVSERVIILTQGRQVPTSRKEMIATDWEL